MDQEKIGKFISILRKEKNLTQEELAERLGVSSKSVSRWENGKNMPDLSLLKPLCEIFDISINELLSGEKLKDDKYREKLEENIINTIDYTNKEVNRTTKKAKIVTIAFSIVVFFIITLSTLFWIDVNRMKNNEPVFFSTWGFKYTPAVNLAEGEIEIAIKDYLVQTNDNEPNHYDNEKSFVSLRTYLIEEKNSMKLFNVYAWVLEGKYYLEDQEIKNDTSSSIPYMFEVQFINNKYVVTDSRMPRDGSYYENDMKSIFPRSVRNDMDEAYSDGTIEKLQLDIDHQVKLYFHQS